MALDAQQVEQLQNSSPTNFAFLDSQLMDRSDADRGRFAMDNKLHVKFYMRSVMNLGKSEEAGRPIYENIEYVEIMAPGEKNSIIERPAASMRDDLRFPQHYEQFKKGQAEQMVGTPLKVLPFLTEAQVDELAWFKIRTVEALANMNDSVQFMGSTEYKRKANEWLDASTSAGVLAKRLDEQAKQLGEQAELIAKLQNPVKVK